MTAPFIVHLSAALAVVPLFAAQEIGGTVEVLPLIQFADVPLNDAVRVLARQARLNCIFDPTLSGSSTGPQGDRVREPLVTRRWEKVTARQALDALLKDHKLLMVENPATTVARIVSKDRPVQPVTTSQVGSDTNGVIPVIQMEDVPLVEAISQLATQAHLKVVLDRRLSALSPKPEVTFRWEKITARQALAALLDNYDLVMIVDSGSSTNRITLKKEID